MSNVVCIDLMVDIFERLPPESIIRFRSLSKYWHSRLVNQEFLHDHRLRCSKNPEKVLIRNHKFCGKQEYKSIFTLHSRQQLPLERQGSGNIRMQGVEFTDDYKKIVGSCNGILCMYSEKEISLWNFSIRRKLIVPQHPFLNFSDEVALGFGFDPVTDDYMIVAICCPATLIYSLKTDSWTVIPSPFVRFYNVKLRRACLLNGILHWVVDGYLTTEPRNVKNCYILTFNLSSHAFGHILLPEPMMVKQLTTINGCLAVVSTEHRDFRNCGDTWIWMMKEYGNTGTWFVRTFPGTEGVCDASRVFQPITNGNILVYKGSKVYNFDEKVFTELMRFGPYCSDVEIEPYVESLELVDKESTTAFGNTVISSWANNSDSISICGCFSSRIYFRIVQSVLF